MTLPSDLESLGNRLEVAALRAVRRRARRQVILNAICALAIMLPVALALATTAGTPVTPSVPVDDELHISFAVSALVPAANIGGRHIPDEWLPPEAPPACSDGNDCGRPVPPTRLVPYPDPARRA
jgi:hypothetical protein